MESKRYIVIQDGTLLEPYIKKRYEEFFTTRDIYDTEKGTYVNFVGFIINKEETLISFPKHFMEYEQLSCLSKDHIKVRSYQRILFQTILKYSKKTDKKHIGLKNELNSGYPFQSFFSVYNYYKKYGLFTHERDIKKYGFQGNISWKDSFEKSPILINNNNILYMPLIIKDKVNDYVFISKCMVHVINSTIDRFSVLLNMNKVDLNINNTDLSNADFVISKLKILKQSFFKDIHLYLINNLINFFEFERKGTDIIQIKTSNFNLIWEDLVQSYLNNYFLKIDPVTEKIHFSTGKVRNNFQKPIIYPDIIDKNKAKDYEGFRIEPDFYLIKDSFRYIFDAKYYQEVINLNYKQISYYFLLKWYEREYTNEGKIIPIKTYNALILPTEKKPYRKRHFTLNPEFNLDEENFIINEYYLNILDLMKSCLSS